MYIYNKHIYNKWSVDSDWGNLRDFGTIVERWICGRLLMRSGVRQTHTYTYVYFCGVFIIFAITALPWNRTYLVVVTNLFVVIATFYCEWSLFQTLWIIFFCFWFLFTRAAVAKHQSLMQFNYVTFVVMLALFAAISHR